jgi:phage tail sheath gpL-like
VGSFTQIPSGIETPFIAIEFNGVKSATGVAVKQRRLLIVGQRLNTGTIPALQPKQVTDANTGSVYFGKGSMLHRMLQEAFKQNTFTETWAVALDDLGGGTQATGALQVTGPATGAGTLAVYIGGRKISTAVAAGASASTIAAALKAAIDLDDELLVTATVSTDTVTLTARHKGLNGNDIDLRANYAPEDLFPAGVGLTVTAMASGAGNPDVDTLWPVLGEIQYDEIALAWSDQTNLTKVETELESRWGPMRAIEGMAFAGARLTLANALTLGNANETKKHVSAMAMEKSVALPEEVAAAYAARAALVLGPDPAQPLQTSALVGIAAPAVVDRFTQTEQQQLLLAGIATYTVDGGGVVRIQRARTFYQENAIGAPDEAYSDVEIHSTLGYLRFDMRVLFGQYGDYKLGDGSTSYATGQKIMTTQLARSLLLARGQVWAERGWIKDFPTLKANLQVEIDPSEDDRLNIFLPVNVVKPLRVIAAAVNFQ